MPIICTVIYRQPHDSISFACINTVDAEAEWGISPPRKDESLDQVQAICPFWIWKLAFESIHLNTGQTIPWDYQLEDADMKVPADKAGRK